MIELNDRPLGRKMLKSAGKVGNSTMKQLKHQVQIIIDGKHTKPVLSNLHADRPNLLNFCNM